MLLFSNALLELEKNFTKLACWMDLLFSTLSGTALKGQGTPNGWQLKGLEMP